jgi:phosphoglycolate phosphatase
MNNIISTVLFDLDGTLLDTAPDLAKALNIVLQQHNRSSLEFDMIRPYSSTGTRGLLHLGFGIEESHPQFSTLREQFLLAYHDHLYDETKLFPGISVLLEHIENTGLHWGVVTNKPTYLARLLLQNFDLETRSACVVGGDTLAKRKPDPDTLLHACKLIGCSTNVCVYVGDAERDVQAAKNANMSSIAALYGYIGSEEKPENWQADFYVSDPLDIIDWLRKFC